MNASAFSVENSLNLNGGASVITGAVDPSSVGVTAPTGSLYLRDSGDMWQKNGPLDTNWVRYASGDATVKIDSADTTQGYLTNKITVAAGSITKTISNIGGNEVLLLDLQNTGVPAGTYKTVTTDAKGRVVAGTNPTTLSGFGITDAQPLSTVLTSFNNQTIDGLIVKAGSSTMVRSVDGSDNILVTNGTGVNGNPTIDLTNTTVTPGTYNSVSVDEKGRIINGANVDYLTSNETITVSGDASGSGTNNLVLTLSNSGVIAGSYTKVVVDSKGRVTSGGAIIATDIPALDWTKIASGKPTTLSGYGITDAVNVSVLGVAGGVATLDATGKIPATQIPAGASNTTTYVVASQVAMLALNAKVGDVAIRTDVNQTYILRSTPSSTLTNWQLLLASNTVTSVNGQTGTVNITNITGNAGTATKLASPSTITFNGDAGGAFSFDGSTSPTCTLTLSNSGVGAGTYNTVTVDAKGRVTAGSNAQYITGNQQISVWGDVTGSGTTNITATLSSTGVVAGTYNTVTVDAKGRVGWGGNTPYLTSNQDIVLSGDVTGSGSTGIYVNLANSGVVAGQYTKVQVDAKGRVTTGLALASYDIPVLDWSKITSGKPTTLSGYGITDALSIYQLGHAGGPASLDATGKIPVSQLPATAIVNTSVVASQAAMLALTAQVGDVAVRTDTSATYILAQEPATTLANWQLLLTPSAGVTSVNGMTGTVSITSVTGNAGTASTLQTARTITLSTDVTGSVTFNGSSDVTIPVTLANSGVIAGTYPKVTVDAKGRVTAGSLLSASDLPSFDWSKIASGKPTTLSGYGITDAQPLSSALTSLSGLVGSGLVRISGSTVSVDAASYLTNNQTITVSGDASGSGTTAIPLTLTNSGVVAGTYTKLTVDSKGRATLGTSLSAADIPLLDWSKIVSGKPTTLSGYGITDAVTTAQVGTAGGVASLDSTGKIPPAQLPSIAVTNTFVVASQAAMLALTAEVGDVAIRTDINQTYILQSSPASTLTNWQSLLTPNSAVTSVNGLTGAVSVTSVTGNAGTATTLQTARTLAVSGDVSGSVLFNGGANATIVTTLANSGVVAGTYKSVTVNAKGIVTAGSTPTTLAGFGITDAQPLSPTLTSLAAATGSAGVLCITAGGTVSTKSITGTAGQTVVIAGDGSSNPTISLAADATFPGNGGVVIPAGTTAQRSASASLGTLRYNTSTFGCEYYNGVDWVPLLSKIATTDFLLRDSTTSSSARVLAFQKDRAGTYPLAGDSLGTVQAQAWTGASYTPAAEIEFVAVTNVNGTTAPSSKITFSTSTASASAPVEAASLWHTGQFVLAPAGVNPTVTGLSQKRFIIADTTTPSFTSAANGMAFSLGNGCGVFIKDTSTGTEGKFESYRGSVGIGVASTTAANLYLFSKSNVTQSVTLDTVGNVTIADGTAEHDSDSRLDVRGGAVTIQPINTTNVGELRFKELSANGSYHVGLKSPDSLNASTVWTLPSTDGDVGQVLTTDGSDRLTFSSPNTVSRQVINMGDDFIGGVAGQLGWVSVVNGSGATANAGSTNIFSSSYNAVGIVRLVTGSTNYGRSSLTLGNNQMVFGYGAYRLEMRVAIGTYMSTSTQRYVARFGFGTNTAAGDFTAGVYFEYDSSASAYWRICTASSSVRTKSSTSVLVDNSAFAKFGISIQGSTATFYIDDVVVGTISTDVPTALTQSVSPIFKIEKAAGTTPCDIIIDYFSLNIILNTSR